MKTRFRYPWFLLGVVVTGIVFAGMGIALAEFRNEQATARHLERSGAVLLWSSQSLEDPEPPNLVKALLQVVTTGTIPRINFADFTHVRGPVSESELELLGQLEDVYYVRLSFRHVTDSGMRHVASLPRLENLEIYGAGVSATALATLSDAAQLRSLRLSVDMIGPAELKALSRLTQLEFLDVNGCPDEATLDVLRDSLPHCEVGSSEAESLRRLFDNYYG